MWKKTLIWVRYREITKKNKIFIFDFKNYTFKKTKEIFKIQQNQRDKLKIKFWKWLIIIKIAIIWIRLE